ncbi:MAG: hypothetical protein AB1650_08065 [Candidatus Omnitrophota bacterium]
MFRPFRKQHKRSFCKSLSLIMNVLFFWTALNPSLALAQSVGALNLPVPGTMVNVSPAFIPVLLKGLTVNSEDLLDFNFIVDSGNSGFNADEVRQESERLVRYFLASMTIPQNDLWVNLSPYEADRIIPEELGRTELGRDLLAQDYILKQLSATLTNPDSELGAKFWNRIHQQAYEKFGTTDVRTDLFNKVWILPESATLYEHDQTVFIVDAHLKVMTDRDYQKTQGGRDSPLNNPESVEDLAQDVIKELILPEIEKEINNGETFAPLRQIYYSLILAKWYKQAVKDSVLSKIYVDQKKTGGIELANDRPVNVINEIYDQYIKAYEKGVFNFIKEDYDALSQAVIPKQYFSGGFRDEAMITRNVSNPGSLGLIQGSAFEVEMRTVPEKNGIPVAPIGEEMLTLSKFIQEKLPVLLTQVSLAKYQNVILNLNGLPIMAIRPWNYHAALYFESDMKKLKESVTGALADVDSINNFTVAENRIKVSASRRMPAATDEAMLTLDYLVEGLYFPRILRLALDQIKARHLYQARRPIFIKLNDAVIGEVYGYEFEEAWKDNEKMQKFMDKIKKIVLDKNVLSISKIDVAGNTINIRENLPVRRVREEIAKKVFDHPEALLRKIVNTPRHKRIMENLIKDYGDFMVRIDPNTMNPSFFPPFKEVADAMHELKILTENFRAGSPNPDFGKKNLILVHAAINRIEQLFKKNWGEATAKVYRDLGMTLYDTAGNVYPVRGVSDDEAQSREVLRNTMLALAEKAGIDSAMLVKNEDTKINGGIDMNEINFTMHGEKTGIRFNPRAMDGLADMDIDGLAPVIINVTPVQNILPLLGFDQKAIETKEQDLAARLD